MGVVPDGGGGGTPLPAAPLPVPPVEGDDVEEIARLTCVTGRGLLRASSVGLWEVVGAEAEVVWREPEGGPPAGSRVSLGSFGNVAGPGRGGAVVVVRVDDPTADPRDRRELREQGLVLAIRVPFTVAGLESWFLSVAWDHEPAYPSAQLAATAELLAAHAAIRLQRMRQVELLWQRALELNDDVAQHLTTALGALEVGGGPDPATLVRTALHATQRIMEELTQAAPPRQRDLRRTAPTPSIAPLQPGPVAIEREQRLLLADDNDDLRMLVRAALERPGDVAIVEAADGLQVLTLAREHDFDSVLLDLSMPGRSGLEVLPELRALQPKARIVVLSGFADAGSVRRARELGADSYLPKGTSLARIIETVLPPTA